MSWVNGGLRRRVRDKAIERRRDKLSEGKRKGRKYGMMKTIKGKEICYSNSFLLQFYYLQQQLPFHLPIFLFSIWLAFM